jgi:CheY-like chemotaxis protein
MASFAQVDVLLVDDDDFCRIVTESLFPSASVAVRVAINGRMALEAVRTQRPDIIILDIEMPIMGGVEALHLIRDHQLQVGQMPSLMVAATGHEDAASLAYFYQVGFDHCVTKPCKATDVHTLLQKLHAAQSAEPATALNPATHPRV